MKPASPVLHRRERDHAPGAKTASHPLEGRPGAHGNGSGAPQGSSQLQLRVRAASEDPGPTPPRPPGARARVEDVLIRALNILVAVVGIILFLPLMLLIAVAIKLDSRGPVLYKQLRIGIDRRSRGEEDTGRRTADLGGRPFLMYKFRTMHVDAETDTGPVWASSHDHRTTRLGRWLREYRLDELPQFFNVLKGDMSVVGPRPERPSFVGRLRDEIDGYTLRHRVPPGITGWAQVNRDADQNIEDVREKLRYDLEYLYHRSLWFDLRIMMRTLPVMLERERASEGP